MGEKLHNQIKTHVTIVGAGLTGLTTAFYLRQRGIPFKLIEKEDRVGGAIETIEEDGFTIEKGPNTGVISHPEVVELFDDLKGLCELEMAQSAVNRRLIWKGDRWHALPSGLISGLSTPLFSLYDKFRLLGEPFRKRGTDPNENLASLVKRRMGKSFLDYAVDPFILGIYSGDPEYLIPRFALPKLYNLEQTYGSFIGGAIKKGRVKKSEREKKATRKIFSVKGGLSNLTNALAEKIGKENILLNTQNISIDFDKVYKITAANGLNISSDVVVTTAGSYELPKMLEFIDTEHHEAFVSLPYAKVAQISLRFKKWEGIDLNAFGGLVPSVEKRNVLGILFPSSFLSGRCPTDGALLSVFVGGYRNPDIVNLNDIDLLNKIKPDLIQMLGLGKFNPDIIRIFRYSHAIPQYGRNTEVRLKTICDLQERYPGLILAGNMRNGIGMADRIKQGKDIAESIITKQ